MALTISLKHNHQYQHNFTALLTIVLAQQDKQGNAQGKTKDNYLWVCPFPNMKEEDLLKVKYNKGTFKSSVYSGS